MANESVPIDQFPDSDLKTPAKPVRIDSTDY